MQPPKYLGRIEVGTIGMTKRKIVRADIAAFAIGDTDTTNIALAGCPAGAFVRAQPIVARLGIERDDAGASQVGQLGRCVPIVAHDTCSVGGAV